MRQDKDGVALFQNDCKLMHYHLAASSSHKHKLIELQDENQYPLLQMYFFMVEGQYDPGEQNKSILLASVQTSAPPQVWFGCPAGIW